MSSGTEFTIRRKVFTLFGAKFHLYRSDGALMGFCRQKAFRLKEDIRIYTDETMTQERLRIGARQIVDFSAAYDVEDSDSGEVLGGLKRRGFKSIFRDEWIVMGPGDEEVGRIREDSALSAFVRRFLPLGALIPQKHVLRDNDETELAEFRTHFNPFVHKMTVTVFPDGPLHPLLILAAGVLMVAIEGRQQS